MAAPAPSANSVQVFFVRPIDITGHAIAAGHEDSRVIGVAGDVFGGHIQARHPGRAGAVDVEGAGVARAQLGLHHRGRGRADVVGRVGGHDDQVEIGRREAGAFQRLPRRRHQHVRGGFVRGHDMPLFDANVGDQPIADVFAEQAVEIRVRQHFFRDVAAGGDDLGVGHGIGWLVG